MPKRILVQAGHIAPREPGFEGGTGTVREQEFTRAMRARIVALLNRDDRFHPIPQPGDLTDVPCDAALFLHGDGSSNPQAHGRSFGFPLHPVNRRLVRRLEQHLSAIPGAPPDHEDNYTDGLRFYYGYRRISTDGPEVLIEFGFLTNPAERRWLFGHLDEMANAVYLALCDFFGLEPRGHVEPARLGFIVVWTDNEGKTHSRRTLTPRRLLDKLWNDGIRRRILIRKEVPIPPAEEANE